ncbi:MAG: hypothetical protein NUV97_04420 [archaeon]|nr:hypothetical protein [archaeon]MCR4323380.1 hypothetical protein [Nanoarchaeota archaeon]
MSRIKPKNIEPIIHKGVRYSVPHFVGDTENMKHVGGYVEAINVKTNERIWLKEIYKQKYVLGLESDIQEVYITSIKIKNNKIIIQNEAGKEFTLDID